MQGKFLRFVPLHHMRFNVLGRKIAGYLCYLLGDFIGFKIHKGQSFEAAKIIAELVFQSCCWRSITWIVS
jgi:hypothetical protein